MPDKVLLKIIKFAMDGSKAELSFEGQHVLPRPDTNHQMDIQTASALLTANKKVGGIMQEILQNFSFRHGTLHVRSAQLIVRYQNLGIKSGFAKRSVSSLSTVMPRTSSATRTSRQSALCSQDFSTGTSYQSSRPAVGVRHMMTRRRKNRPDF